jgi:cell wall-associated NlpC family hydrolase
MADPITKPEIRRLPVLPYEAARAELRSGDLIFCSGSYAFSGMIQRFTRSVWSHVGVIWRDDTLGRVFVLESEAGIGVRVVPVSKYLLDYHGRRRPYRGQIVVAQIAPDIPRERVHRAVSFGLDELTKPYDNGEILRIAARILFRRGRGARDRKYICSELVDECFRRADVRFARTDNYISPDDIWRDATVKMRFRVL